MACRLNRNTGVGLLVVVLAIILVSGGLLAACSRTQTTTTTTVTTSATSTTTTVKPTATSTATTATTSATSTSTTATLPATSVATTASAAAKFYKDNVVTIIVPYGPGGTTDYAARLIANYWPEVTGGRMIVENKSGAGSLLALNYSYAAKPDGLTIGEGIMDSILSFALAQDPAMKFDYKKMNWIEFTNPGDPDGLTVGAKSPYNSMQDLSKAKGLKFAAAGSSEDASGTALIIDLFGLKDARIVLGYAGAAEMQLAVAKGEVDAYSMDGSVIKEGMGKGLNKQSFLTLGFVRSNYFPDAPAVPELLKLSPEQESLLRTYAALRGGQVFWFQPGVPQDRIDFVRNAFDKIVALEGFLKQSASKWQYVPPVSGKDFAVEIEKTLAVVTPQRYSELILLADKYVR